jgi:hypothetical protein
MQRFSNSAYWSGSHQHAAKGLWPRETEIAQGTILYRFIDLSKSPSVIGADGPWWFEYEYYQTMKVFSERHGYSLGYCARIFAAILYEWSEVNAVVRAEVIDGPLKVWKGRGKQVEATQSDPRDVTAPHGSITASATQYNRKMTPMQGRLEVLQLFIPGLGKPYNKFSSLMKIKDVEQIRTD